LASRLKVRRESGERRAAYCHVVARSPDRARMTRAAARRRDRGAYRLLDLEANARDS